MLRFTAGFLALTGAELASICATSSSQANCTPASIAVTSYVRFIAQQMNIEGAEDLEVVMTQGTTAFTGGLGLHCRHFVALPPASLVMFGPQEPLSDAGIVYLNGELVRKQEEMKKVLWETRRTRQALAFTVAHELAHVKNNDLLTRSVVSGATTMAWITLLAKGMKATTAGLTTRAARIGVRGLGGIVGLAGFFKIRSFITQLQENRADSDAARFSRRAAVGGVQFFGNQKALAEYMESEGHTYVGTTRAIWQFFSSHPESSARLRNLQRLVDDQAVEAQKDPLEELEIYERAIDMSKWMEKDFLPNI